MSEMSSQSSVLSVSDWLLAVSRSLLANPIGGNGGGIPMPSGIMIEMMLLILLMLLRIWFLRRWI